MKICSRCVLPETFPGIKFDADGVCQHCLRHEKVPEERHLETRKRFKAKFGELAEKVKGKGPYDVLMAYSGGKDSTYTLRYLSREAGLKVLAMTFDNGFLSPTAFRNIRTITGALDVDQITLALGYQTAKTAFRRSAAEDRYPIKSLERASSICNTCMYLAKAAILKTAIEKGIPMIAYGWSPGQAPVRSSVMKLSDPMVRQNQDMVRNCLEPLMGRELDCFLLRERHYRMAAEMEKEFDGSFLYNVHPLAFLDYDEDEIIRNIAEMGWIEPSDTDSNSTNCLLNSFANLVHQKKYGFHPYAFENAGLVREGVMSREEGLEKLDKKPNPNIVEEVRRRLDIESI